MMDDLNLWESNRQSALLPELHDNTSDLVDLGPFTPIFSFSSASESSISSNLWPESAEYAPKYSEPSNINANLANENNAPENSSHIPKLEQGLLTEGPPPKRGRGRPRKHEPQSASTKSTHVRSKTGCYTCRRRKKKCDETGFPCMNCQKTANTTCEGYPQMFAEQKHNRIGYPEVSSSSSSSVDLGFRKDISSSLLDSKDEVDTFLLENFRFHLSSVLSVNQNDQNPYISILLPMAFTHRGLTSSILCLSATHLSHREPSTELFERRDFYRKEALKSLINIKEDGNNATDDAVNAQALVLCLESTFNFDQDSQSQYGTHLDFIIKSFAVANLQDSSFRKFLNEFRLYSMVCNSVTSPNRRHLSIDNFDSAQYQEPPLLYVQPSLLYSLARITSLRNRMRWHRRHSLIPSLNEHILLEAGTLETTLQISYQRSLQQDSDGSLSYIMNLLYWQCVWVYLYRTYDAPAGNLQVREKVDKGLICLTHLQLYPSAGAVLLLPIFLLSCGALDTGQRNQLRSAFDRLLVYRESGNIGYARKVVERIWSIMDENDQESRDWETIIQSMGLDFLLI